MLLVEALLLGSWPIFLWLTLFFLANVLLSPYLKNGLWRTDSGLTTVSTKNMFPAGSLVFVPGNQLTGVKLLTISLNSIRYDGLHVFHDHHFIENCR